MFEEDEFNILKKQAEGLEVPVRDKVWQNISSRLVKPDRPDVRLRKLSVGLFICLIGSFSLMYLLESSIKEQARSLPGSPIIGDVLTKPRGQDRTISPPDRDNTVIPQSRSVHNLVAEPLFVDHPDGKWGESGNRANTVNLSEIPSLVFPPLEVSLPFTTGSPLKTKASSKKPRKGVALRSVDLGMGSIMNYSKKQPGTSDLIEQGYVAYINKTAKKTVPLSASIMANLEWPGGLSVGTGLQFLHFNERVSYGMEIDSFIVLVDDGRGGMDTNTVYYEKALPGFGNTIEIRTSQLQLPVLVNFHWRLHKKVDVGLNAGFNVGLYSAHRSKSEHDHIPGISSFMAKQDHGSFLYSVGAQVSAGLEYRISDNSSFVLKFNYVNTLWNKRPSAGFVQRSFGSELNYRITIR